MDSSGQANSVRLAQGSHSGAPAFPEDVAPRLSYDSQVLHPLPKVPSLCPRLPVMKRLVTFDHPQKSIRLAGNTCPGQRLESTWEDIKEVKSSGDIATSVGLGSQSKADRTKPARLKSSSRGRVSEQSKMGELAERILKWGSHCQFYRNGLSFCQMANTSQSKLNHV